MTTNKTVNQVFTANKKLEGQMKVTFENSQVFLEGTPSAFRMLAEVLMATVGGGGNTFAQGFKAQMVKNEASGFILTPDSADAVILHCTEDVVATQPKVT